MGDHTGKVEVGFARESGEKLMQMDAAAFRSTFKHPAIFHEYLMKKLLIS